MQKRNYKCLVLDHDDTVVNSTATVHFPAFSQALATLRPEITLTLEEYFRYNFEPGFGSLCKDILHFTEKEMDFQTKNWLKRVSEYVPEAFPGMKEILWEFKRRGGYVCVSSHSMKENILRDYAQNALPQPDLVFGWGLQPEQRKPAPYALQQIMKEFSLKPEELVMVDDLKPGKVMADSCGVDFIAAGWAHAVPEIVEYMKRECKKYCCSVEEFRGQIL